MTSVEPVPASGSRRKRGWIFLAAFVAQAVVFAVLIAQIARQMPAATMLEDAANPTGQASTTAQLSAEDAERLRLKLALLLLGASTFSIVTLAGALIGLRRPPQPIEEGAVSSAGENPPR